MMDNAKQVLQFIDGLLSADLVRYQLYTSGMQRLLVSAMIEADLSEKTASDFHKQVLDFLLKAQSAERDSIDAQIQRLLTLTGLPASTTGDALVQTATEELKDAMTSQMRRDALTVETHFQRIRTTAYLINESRRMGAAQAMRLAYLQNKSLMRTVFVDRAGRRWQSGTYVRTVFREHYLGLVNDLEVLRLGEQGLDRAAYRYPDGHEISFGIGRTVGLPSYEETKRLHFHPNSSALVHGILTTE